MDWTDRSEKCALVPQSYLALSQVYPLRPRSAGCNGHSVIPCVRTSASTSFAPLARSGSKDPPSLARHAPAFRSPGHVRPASRAFSASIIFQPFRSEEHTSELQSLMRISYAVFCLKKKTKPQHYSYIASHQSHI